MDLNQFHNSAMATVQAFYSLCEMPEYVQHLRTEARRALCQSDGVWTMKSLADLRELDSFLKESQRLNGSSFRALSQRSEVGP